MRPVRVWPALWRGDLPPERRMALAATAALVLLIGGMALYQLRAAPDAGREPEAADAGAPSPAADAAGAAAQDPAAPAGAEPAPVPEPAVKAFSWPLGGRPRVVMHFGAVDGSLGDWRLSDGLVLEATPGQPVVAAAAGTVASVEEHPVDGLAVVLDHGDGKQSRYAGLAEASVTAGQAVKAGEPIGRVGLPAEARRGLGPHLLFALLVDGEPVDPLEYLEE